MTRLLDAITPSLPAPTPACRDQETVLFALAEEDYRRFHPLFDSADLPPPARCHWTNISQLTSQDWETRLKETQPTIMVTGWGTRPIPPAIQENHGGSLRYVCHLAGSVRPVVTRQQIEEGLIVSNWGSAISHTVAEHALLLTMAALRCLPRWPVCMERWPLKRTLPTRSLFRKRVGIHGFGNVARELIKILDPFEVEIGVYSHGVPVSAIEGDGRIAFPDLKSLFARSDIVVECEALNALSHGSVDAETLRCLPDGAVFVNVGRGYVVDEEALVEVTRQKGLRLGIDVFHREPSTPENPFFTIPDAICSPHIAGPTQDSFTEIWRHTLENLRRYLAGDTIRGQVFAEAYDRMT